MVLTSTLLYIDEKGSAGKRDVKAAQGFYDGRRGCWREDTEVMIGGGSSQGAAMDIQPGHVCDVGVSALQPRQVGDAHMSKVVVHSCIAFTRRRGVLTHACESLTTSFSALWVRLAQATF